MELYSSSRGLSNRPRWSVSRQRIGESDVGPSLSVGNDTYGITGIPSAVAGRGILRRAALVDGTKGIYPRSGRKDA